MGLLYDLLVVAHLLGMAALVGGAIGLARGGAATTWVLVWGARAQLVTGLLLVGLGSAVESLGQSPDNAKVAVKLLVAVAAAGCAEVSHGRTRRGGSAVGIGLLAGGLGAVNVLVAVLWT